MSGTPPGTLAAALAANVPHAGAWVAPRPADLPDLRIQMCEQVLNQPHCGEFPMRIAAGISPLIPTISGPPEETAAVGIVGGMLMARSEQRRLRHAQLYWVDEDMTSLALAVVASPSHEPVRARRMPAESGLMLFAQPIGSHDIALATALTGPWSTPSPNLNNELRLSFPVVAVSWSRWRPTDLDLDGAPGTIRWTPRTPEGAAPLTPEFDGVWLTFWTTSSKGWDTFPPNTPLAIDNHNGKTITARDLAIRETLTGVTTLRTYDELLLRFDRPLPHPDPDTGGQWAHVVYTAWQLMGQTGNTLTETQTLSRPRHGLKRDKRAHIPEPGTVRLVRVHTRHRPSTQASAQDAAASHGRRAPQWTRRWTVRPYRRNTCLNPHAHAEGGCDHDERIVPEHTKGPADKPLLATNRVHLWDTAPPEP